MLVESRLCKVSPKTQGQKVVSYSHDSNLVGHSAKFETKLERQDSS
jgi:hypothetical protein